MTDWDKRIDRIKKAIGDAGRLSSDDPGLNELIGEISRQIAELRNDEGAAGRPIWVKSDRQIRKDLRDHKRRTQPVLDAIKRKIESETAKTWDWGKELWVRCDRELTHVGFDVWYQRDEELERDRSSGRRAELASIMRAAAKQIANADSEVRFHSHHTVQEKCGGDYFDYLR